MVKNVLLLIMWANGGRLYKSSPRKMRPRAKFIVNVHTHSSNKEEIRQIPFSLLASIFNAILSSDFPSALTFPL